MRWPDDPLPSDPLPSGLVVACFDVTSVQGSDDLVTFSRKSAERSEHGTKVHFLKNVQHARWMVNKEGYTLDATHQYVAEEIIAFEDVRSFLNKQSLDREDAKPLFCIHGFNVHITIMFKMINDAEVKFKEEGIYFPIPVLWATHGVLAKYYDDKQKAERAGIGLKQILIQISQIDRTMSKSLLCHSMGNRVLCYASDGKVSRKVDDPSPNGLYDNVHINEKTLNDSYDNVNFDDIFMVAADVPQDLFDEYPEEGQAMYGLRKLRYNLRGKRTIAKNIRKMLKKRVRNPLKDEHHSTIEILKEAREREPGAVGKIHILHNKYDRALGLSAYALNATTRLGERGALKRWRFWKWEKDGTLWGTWWSDPFTVAQKALRYLLTNENCDLLPQTHDWFNKHSYQFEGWAIRYYNQAARKNE